MRIKKSQFEAMHTERVQELESQLREQSLILKDYRKDHGKLEVFFDRIVREIKSIDPLPVIYKSIKKQSKSKCVAVIHNSDWHTGEVQDPAEVEFINAYDPEIQVKRISEMDRIFLRWTETLRGEYSIEEARIICTGDMISGDIHRELSVTNAYPVPVQVCEAAAMFANHAATIAQYFGSVVIDYVVPDNHSRLTVKPQAKEAGLNSMNYIVAMMAKQYLGKHSGIDFRIHTEIEKVVDVNGQKYLCSHGNNIKSWMGVPWYSIERHIGKEAKARQFLMMQDMSIERMKSLGFHKYIFGHFHTDFNSDFYACAGSLSGTSAFDHENGRYSPPSQPIWLVHEQHGELNRTAIRL